MTPRQENIITENTPGTSTECSPVKKKEILYWVCKLQFCIGVVVVWYCVVFTVRFLGTLNRWEDFRLYSKKCEIFVFFKKITGHVIWHPKSDVYRNFGPPTHRVGGDIHKTP